MRYKIFGCKTNKYFTEKWMEDPLLRDAKGVFVASCIVTEKAEKKWKKFVEREMKTLGPDEKLYLSGCASIKNGDIETQFYELHPELAVYRDTIVLLGENPEEELARKFLPDTEGVLNHKNLRVESLSRLTEGLRSASMEASVKTSTIFTRKYLVIQTGCDNHCTFCLTILARGKHKNRSEGAIIEEIQSFADAGWSEVVLTGTNIGAWGASNSNRFEDSKFVSLLRSILENTSIQKLRISSLWVEFLSDELLELLRHPRMHAYVHLSIQSASDSILASMGRRYDRATLLERLEKLSSLKREDGTLINIGADIIVGFPGETDADFLETCELVQDFSISNLHAFPFSPHSGSVMVPAGKMENPVDERVKLERQSILQDIGQRVRAEFLRKNNGRELCLLLEGNPTETAFHGYSDNHIALSEANFAPQSGSIMRRGEMIRGIYHFREEDVIIQEEE